MIFRIYLCLVSLCSLTGSIFSQQLSAGLSVGPNLSTLDFEEPALFPIDVEIDPYDYKFGFIAAGNFTFQLSNNIGLRGEINFERKGGQAALAFSRPNGDPLPDTTINDRFDYLQFPLLLQLSAGGANKIHFHLGYSFNRLLRYETYLPEQIYVRTPTQNWAVQMPQQYRKSSRSLIVGLAFSTPLYSNLALQLAGRANLGLRNINESDGFEIKNKSFALMAGLQVAFR